MKYKTFILLIFLPVLVICQNKTSVNLFVNYPLLKNKNNTQVNNVLHTSVYEKITYSEKPGISLFASQEFSFVYNSTLLLGVGFDWLNYGLNYNETSLIPQNTYVSSVQNPIIIKYNAQNPSFNNTILFMSVPVNCKYPLLAGKISAIGGVAANILVYNNQEFSYIKYVPSNGTIRIENHTDETNEGINRLLLLLNLGCEYTINEDLSITINYKVGLTPLYERQYNLIDNSALNIFSIGAKYCFLK